MNAKFELRDVLLFLILVMLIVNALARLGPKRAGADTFKLDDCITTAPKDKPSAYLHVVTH